MPTTIETGFEPDPHNLEDKIFGDQAFTDRKDIGVIMLPGQLSRFFIPAKRTAHPVHFVGHHSFAVARSTEHDTALTFTARYRFRRRANEKRIIDVVFTEGAEIFHFVPERAEQFFHLFLVAKTGVSCSERNLHETRITRIATNFIKVESIPSSQFVLVCEIRVYPPCSFASSRQISRSRSVTFFGTLI